MSDRSHLRIANPDAAALHINFFTVFPRIVRHARFSFRHLRREHDHDDAVAEVVALAWHWFVRLVRQGKHPETYVSAIAAYAARAVKAGRRLCGQEMAKDVLSRQTQSRRGFTVRRFSGFSGSDCSTLEEALQDDATTPVPDQVSFRLDFPSWLATRSARDRKLIGALIAGERSQDAASRLRISPGRVAQLRRSYWVDWRLFCDEPV